MCRKAAEELKRQAYARFPHLKITELLIEVDHWTGFTRHYTHLKNGERAQESQIHLPRKDGLRVVEELMSGGPPKPRIIVITTYEDEEDIRRALTA